MERREMIAEAADAIKSRCDIRPRMLIMLGSGLGETAEAVQGATVIDSSDIPHWPRSTAFGHAGRLVMGTIEGMQVGVMQGRVHFYEGYSMDEVTFPIRVFSSLGTEILFATNASGGVNLGYAPGELAVIYDHINFMGTNPLIGPNDESEGPRFPDMSYAYDREYIDMLTEAARESGITLHRGVYMAFTGPSYETPAEIRMARTMGADLVGMSTVPEVIAANHAGMRTAAVSYITNHAAGVTADRLDHHEMLARMEDASRSIAALIKGFIRRIGGDAKDA